MKKNLQIGTALLLTMVMLSSCDLVGGIFKAGFYSAIIIIVLVIVVLFWLFRRRR